MMNSKSMKAVVCTRYGSPAFLIVKEVEIPSPSEYEVLIKVYASTVTAADSMMRRAIPMISRLFLGLFRPRKAIIGTGFAGKVVAVGKDVNKFRPGDEVFGETGVNFGANAEYLCLSEDGAMVLKPEELSFEEAATFTDGPMTSYNFLKSLGNLQPGQKVLINGASGSLGTAAVQIATYLEAEVTGVCSGKNAEWVKNLGAKEVIDYQSTDLLTLNKTYDLIFDTVGKLSYSTSKHLLSSKGIYLSPVLSFSLLFQMLLTSLTGKGRKKAKFSATGLLPSSTLRSYLDKLVQMYLDHHIRIVIDKMLPLAQTAEGHTYVDSGHKKGNVVIIV